MNSMRPTMFMYEQTTECCITRNILLSEQAGITSRLKETRLDYTPKTVDIHEYMTEKYNEKS